VQVAARQLRKGKVDRGNLATTTTTHDDIIMGPGEVAEFDTRLPHWFGAAGDQPVEILSLLSREGQRIHVRAAPRRKSSKS
jgi:Cupin domain